MVDTLLAVVLSDRGGLSVVDIEALLDRLEVVIATSATHPSLEGALDQFVFADTELEDCVDGSAMLGKEFVKGFRLSDGAGESVEDESTLRLTFF